MTREEAIQFVRDNTPEATVALYKALQDQQQQLREKIGDACKAYFADINAKIDKIRDQVQNLNARKDQIEAEKEPNNKAFMNATLSGDPATLRSIQERMAASEAELLAIQEQIKALTGIPIPGSKERYGEVTAAVSALEKSKEEDLLGAIYEEMQRITDVYKEIIGGSVELYYDPERDWQKKFLKVKMNFSGREPIIADTKRLPNL